MTPKSLLSNAAETASAQIREQIDLPLFLTMLAVSLAAAFFAAWLYRSFFERRGTGSQIHRAFPLLAIATTALFVGVQVSIPLSLGLLGSLSFIRFRTPVKEPEEVGFLILVIASSICSATKNFAFVFWLLAFSVAAVLLQRGAAALRWARRDERTAEVTILVPPNGKAVFESEADGARMALGSGEHRFEVKLQKED